MTNFCIVKSPKKIDMYNSTRNVLGLFCPALLVTSSRVVKWYADIHCADCTKWLFDCQHGTLKTAICGIGTINITSHLVLLAQWIFAYHFTHLVCVLQDEKITPKMNWYTHKAKSIISTLCNSRKPSEQWYYYNFKWITRTHENIPREPGWEALSSNNAIALISDKQAILIDLDFNTRYSNSIS